MKRSRRIAIVGWMLVSCGILLDQASAQSSSCSAQVLVSVVKTIDGVTNVKATARNQVTKKVYSSVLKDDFPYFWSLPEGDYKIILTRPGFKRSVMMRYHDCSSHEEGTYEWTAEMFRGSSAVTVDLGPEQVFTAPASEPESVQVGPKTLSGGVLNGKAIALPSPEYPTAVRAAKVFGTVEVEIVVGTSGEVISARAISGNPLLREAAEKAARAAKFSPTTLSGQPVKIKGVLTYEFVP